MQKSTSTTSSFITSRSSRKLWRGPCSRWSSYFQVMRTLPASEFGLCNRLCKRAVRGQRHKLEANTPKLNSPKEINGGGGGIRTHETLSGLTVFKTAGFNRSPTPPKLSGLIIVACTPLSRQHYSQFSRPKNILWRFLRLSFLTVHAKSRTP